MRRIVAALAGPWIPLILAAYFFLMLVTGGPRWALHHDIRGLFNVGLPIICLVLALLQVWLPWWKRQAPEHPTNRPLKFAPRWMKVWLTVLGLLFCVGLIGDVILLFTHTGQFVVACIFASTLVLFLALVVSAAATSLLWREPRVE